MKNMLTRLVLEAAEDRLTPSHGWDHSTPQPAFGPAATYALPARDGVREFPYRSAAFGWEGGPPPRFLIMLANQNRPAPANDATPPGERPATASGQRGTAAEVRATVAAEEAVAVTKVAAVVRPVATDRGVTAVLTPGGPPPAPAFLPTPPPDRAADTRLVPPGDKPTAAADGTWPVLFVATTVDTPAPQPVPDASQPEVPARATPLEDAPAPSVVERAIDAMLPGGLPLHGVLPLAADWIETGAADLLAGLDDLTADATDGVPAWERMTWLAGAVLVLGGVTYTVGTRRGRRPDRAVIGTDSALARWEDRNARRTPG